MNCKEELKNRYTYLYENAKYLLALYLSIVKPKFNFNSKYDDQFEINREYYDINIPDNLKLAIEEFLLGDIEYQKSNLYLFIEHIKNDKCYLNKLKIKFNEIKKYNESINEDISKINLSIGKLLEIIYDYIERQPQNKDSKSKLKVLDEYFRLFRYENNLKTIYGGRRLNFWKDKQVNDDIEFNNLPRLKFRGIKINKFITSIVRYLKYDNDSIFTEAEKQKIYLQFHDELPWNLECLCTSDDTINRPEETNPCGKPFYLKAEQMYYINGLFYQICPNCGYIVKIDDKLLSKSIRKRIISRSKTIKNIELSVPTLSKYKSIYSRELKEHQKKLK